jgi:hypothetical protein
MNPEQALEVLDQATQPGVRMTRQAYMQVEEALRVLADVALPNKEEESSESE